MKLIVECSQKLVRLGENLWGKEQKLDKSEPLDVPTMTTEFIKEIGGLPWIGVLYEKGSERPRNNICKSYV